MNYNGDRKAYWRTKSVEYPFHVRTAKRVANPTAIPTSVYGHFVAVPFADYVMWGFLTEELANKFAEKYGFRWPRVAREKRAIQV